MYVTYYHNVQNDNLLRVIFLVHCTFMHSTCYSSFKKFHIPYVCMSSRSLSFFDGAISFFFNKLNTCALSSIFTLRQVLYLLSFDKCLELCSRRAHPLFLSFSLSLFSLSCCNLYFFFFIVLSLSTTDRLWYFEIALSYSLSKERGSVCFLRTI